MKLEIYDYVIVGGGMSGLSLAKEMILAGLTKEKKLLVIEKRDKYERDKIWSFWNIDQSNYQKVTLKTWGSFSLSYHDEEIIIDNTYNYVSVDSKLFYSEIIDKINSDKNSTIMMNSRVKHIHYNDNVISIELSNQIHIKTKYLFDSSYEINSINLGPYDLYQHFKGIEIEIKNDKFDPEKFNLMDFNSPQKDGLHFMYILPLSKRKALIEATWFSKQVLSNERYQSYIDNYLEKIGITKYDIHYEEIGVIPMFVSSLNHSPKLNNLIYIGTKGGLTRSSTGYTFLNSQNHAKNIVNSLKYKKESSIHVIPKRSRFMDEIFLRVLSKYPHLGPKIFIELFKRNSSNTIIHFLSGTSSIKEDLRIMIKIPHILYFVKEAILQLFKKLIY